MSESLADRVHGLRNVIGAIVLNLEIAAEPGCEEAVRRAAIADALAEANQLDPALTELLAAMEKSG